MILVNFWRYPDPYQRFLIRIRIRPNDTDPTGSGSETLHTRVVYTPSLTWLTRDTCLTRASLTRCRASVYLPYGLPFQHMQC